MKGLSNVSKVIILAVVAAILIIVAIVYNQGGNSTQDNTSNVSATTATSSTETSTQPATSPQANTKASTGHPAVPIVNGPPAPVISIITPVGNDVWTIGTKNVISWNKAGNITGSISLINESNQSFAGIILPEIGPDQTSYTWNTLSVSLNRTDPAGKDITPGIYEIEITYDGNNIKPATSFPFSIIN